MKKIWFALIFFVSITAISYLVIGFLSNKKKEDTSLGEHDFIVKSITNKAKKKLFKICMRDNNFSDCYYSIAMKRHKEWEN
jgi:hypothetical protein